MLQEVNKKYAAEVEAQRKRGNDEKQAAEAALKVRFHYYRIRDIIS